MEANYRYLERASSAEAELSTLKADIPAGFDCTMPLTEEPPAHAWPPYAFVAILNAQMLNSVNY
ncbi:hypothetical protein N8E89_24095 (plasmid) [Phyllobacterium sp. A18/5-2]|uniref:hypothetical protein n=1 Tax=Phyllobacterium sp. A18/5-2 TaxID=2978392 RepID=UPI0021C9F12D|nr:hypothetical protein [Phyllobacterium sp. A18/5-2]UXN66262.1 hypothetical protein N8E89_24095 [Phyllobacterium sp. A18/5-2]